MNWAWASSLDQIWHSPSFPMWLTMAAAGFVGIIVLIAVLRAEKSVANVVLALIALLAIGVASAAAMHSFGAGEGAAVAETRPMPQQGAVLPQLSCIDDLAGDAVLTACEKVLFGSAESAAAAVAYAAAQISRLTSAGDAATSRNANSDLLALRRAVERDRYGLMAYVLTARDQCTPAACPAFRSLGDHRQVATNMEERLYESMIMRHAASWNAPAMAPPSAGLLAALPPSMPTGKPTTAEFPSSANTPPVNIMTPEPPPGAPPKPAAAPAAPRPAAAPPAPAASQAQAQQPARKPPPPKRSPAPVQIAPAAQAPTATNEE